MTLVVLVSQAVAQKQSETEQAKLKFLVGSFMTETTIQGRSKPIKGAGTSVITWTLDSAFLLIEEESISPMMGHYKGHGILGFDTPTHQYMLSMFNNFGDHPSYKGNFVGDTLVLETKVPMPGKSFDQKLLWYKDGDRVKLKVQNDMGNGFVTVIDQTSTPALEKTK